MTDYTGEVLRAAVALGECLRANKSMDSVELVDVGRPVWLVPAILSGDVCDALADLIGPVDVCVWPDGTGWYSQVLREVPGEPHIGADCTHHDRRAARGIAMAAAVEAYFGTDEGADDDR